MDAKAAAPEPGRDLAVFPLAVPSIAGPGAMMAVILLTDNDVYTVAEQARTGVVLLVVMLLTCCFFPMPSCGYRPFGSGHSCPCHGNHSCLTRGGNRADDIGSGKLGARSALEFPLNVGSSIFAVFVLPNS